jgi:superfamily II DNA or RNA helicase
MIAEIVRLATHKPNGFVLVMVHTTELKAQLRQSFERQDCNMDNICIASAIQVRNVLNGKTNRIGYKTPTLIVTDETHHSLAKSYTEVYNELANVPRLGFSATPWRLNGSSFKDVYGTLIQGKSVKWLIEHNSLAPFRYFSATIINKSKLKKRSGEYTESSMDDALTDDKTKVFGNIVETYKDKAIGQQAILYAYSVESSVDISERFNEEGIVSEHIDGSMKAQDREAIIDRFRKGEIKVLCNYNIVSEGFDVPECSVTILARPTASLVLYLQQSMRSMRYQPGKTAIIIDHALNYQEHGFPNDDRDWEKSFNGGHKKSSSNEQVPGISECVECFAAFYREDAERVVISETETQIICPMCGCVAETIIKSEQTEIEDEGIEIVEIDPDVIALANRSYTTDISQNVETAMARAQTNGKNPVYSFMGGTVIQKHMRFTYSDLQNIAGCFNKSYGAINHAYQWALKQSKQQSSIEKLFN